VYDAYLHFLTLDGSLQATSTSPANGEAIICKRVGKIYYWVPVALRKEFFALSLATTAQRGLPVIEPATIQVTLQQVVPDRYGKLYEPVDPKMPGLYKFLVVLYGPQGSRVPNKDGFMELDGKSINVDAYIPQTGPQPNTTDRLWIYVDFTPQPDPTDAKKNTIQAPLKATKPDELIGAINTQNPKATLSIRGRKPRTLTTEELLNTLNFNQQQTNFNLLRLGAP
jgi:hypothetical protein